MILVIITSVFMAAGIADKLVFQSRFGYGRRFDEGIMAMGPLALSMVGVMCAAPLLGRLLTPAFTPLYRLIGGDPAMAAGALLACDMGGYPLARAMTDDVQIQQLSGIYVGAMMGATVVFSVPVSLNIVKQEDRPFLAKGFLAGFVSVPVGAFFSALFGGMGPLPALRNLLPLIVFALLLAGGMLKFPAGMLKGFHLFARGVTALIHVFFGAAIIEKLTGFALIPGMEPIGPQLETVGVIAITLAGAYPMVHFISTVFHRPLMALGKLLGVDGEAAAGMVACLANTIPVFGMVKDMDPRGKVLATAFSVCASSTLGAHLGYAAAQAPAAVLPMIAGKLLGGGAALLFASFLLSREESSHLN